MQDPVVAADSFTYERSWVEECFKRQPNKSPMTGKDITNTVPCLPEFPCWWALATFNAARQSRV